jgi:hypothetical protein
MTSKPLVLIVGSAIAIALGGTRAGPIVALVLVSILAYELLSRVAQKGN